MSISSSYLNLQVQYEIPHANEIKHDTIRKNIMTTVNCLSNVITQQRIITAIITNFHKQFLNNNLEKQDKMSGPSTVVQMIE